MSMPGLPNLGNTCYINCVLQCLMACSAFKRYIGGGHDGTPTRKRSQSGRDHTSTTEDDVVSPKPDVGKALRTRSTSSMTIPEVTPALRALHLTRSDDNDDVVSLRIRSFCRAFSRTHPQWSFRYQQDAQEFLMTLLERIKEETGVDIHAPTCAEKQTYASYPPASSLPRAAHVGIQKMETKLHAEGAKHWAISHTRKYCAVSEMFDGQYISRITCGHCREMYHNFEILDCLPLATHQLRRSSVMDADTHTIPIHICLEVLFAEETLHEWKCDKCGSKSPKTTRVYRCWKAPRILAVVINRYTESGNKDRLAIDLSSNGGKIVVDIDRHSAGPIARNRRGDTFRLRSVVCHSGNNIDGGHYYALSSRKRATTNTRNTADEARGGWTVYDDDCVTHTLKPQGKDAYILFMERTRVRR